MSASGEPCSTAEYRRELLDRVLRTPSELGLTDVNAAAFARGMNRVAGGVLTRISTTNRARAGPTCGSIGLTRL